MYKAYSKELNELINLYFSVVDESTIESQLAGDEEVKKMMMPLMYIDSYKAKSEVTVRIKL